MRVTGNRSLSRDTVRGLEAAVAAGPPQIKADLASLFQAGFEKHNGYLVGGFGRYGIDFRLRAVIATIGLGAFTSDRAIFAMSPTDRSGAPLSGSSAYVMHLPSLPPVNQGWTVTVYSLQGFLIPNPIKRYQFNDRSKLTRNPDGSVDIYLQSTEPSDPAQAANWLPTARRAGVRGDLAPAGAQAGPDRGHPGRQRLAAAGDHSDALTRPVEGRASASPCRPCPATGAA